jgi:hypothetical protein
VRDIQRTIIEGSRPRHPDTATVVMFVNQEDTATVLQGFTITGGRGTLWIDAKDLREFREGGGILCELSSPTIRFNHIVDNQAVDTARALSAGGGGDPLRLCRADHRGEPDRSKPRAVWRRGRELPAGLQGPLVGFEA